MGFWRAWERSWRGQPYSYVDYEAVSEAAEEGYVAGFAQAQNLYEEEADESFTDRWRITPEESDNTWRDIAQKQLDRGYTETQIEEMYYDFLTPEAKMRLEARKMKDPMYRTIDRLYRNIMGGQSYGVPECTLNQFCGTLQAMGFDLEFLLYFVGNCAFDRDVKIDVGVLLRALATFNVSKEDIVRIIFTDELLERTMYESGTHDLITDQEFIDEVLSLDPKIEGDAFVWEAGKCDPNDPDVLNQEANLGGRIWMTGKHLGLKLRVQWMSTGRCVVGFWDGKKPSYYR